MSDHRMLACIEHACILWESKDEGRRRNENRERENWERKMKNFSNWYNEWICAGLELYTIASKLRTKAPKQGVTNYTKL